MLEKFYRAIVHDGIREGWLRFAMLEWCGAPAAFDISLVRGSRQITYLVSRDASIRGYSPGRVLQRHVIRVAAAEGLRTFDFGLGDESYKLLNATGSHEVANWFMYP